MKYLYPVIVSIALIVLVIHAPRKESFSSPGLLETAYDMTGSSGQMSNFSPIAPQTVTQRSALRGNWVNTNISYYGGSRKDDNGIGFVNVDLRKLGQSGVTFNGRRVYPVAVHQDNAPSWLWKVVEITSNDKKVNGMYGWVVDICDRKDTGSGDDKGCNNRKMNGLNFLVDIHSTGWKAARTNGNKLHTGKVRIVGALPPTKVSRSAWRKGYVMCRCSGACDSTKTQTWQPNFGKC